MQKNAEGAIHTPKHDPSKCRRGNAEGAIHTPKHDPRVQKGSAEGAECRRGHPYSAMQKGPSILRNTTQECRRGVQKGPSILRNTTQALEPKMDSHRLSRFRDLACEPEE